MSSNEELKAGKVEGREEVTDGAQKRARVRVIKCPKCGSDDYEVIQQDIFFRMKLLCKKCQFTWWVE